MAKHMVYIPVKLLGQLLEELERKLPYESGGILMGEHRNNAEWIITHITFPGPKAIHKQFSYKPDQEHDEKEVDRIYTETYCTAVYLGDWHTHPGSNAYISEKDKAVLRSIAKTKESRMPFPIMMVIGSLPIEIGCWTIVKSKMFKKEFLPVPVALQHSKD